MVVVRQHAHTLPYTLPLAAPERDSCACSWLLVALGGSTLPRGEVEPLGAQPLPKLLEPAASEVADSTAFSHPGGLRHHGTERNFGMPARRTPFSCPQGRQRLIGMPGVVPSGPGGTHTLLTPERSRGRSAALGGCVQLASEQPHLSLEMTPARPHRNFGCVWLRAQP